MTDTLTNIFGTILTRIRALESRPQIPQSYYNIVVNGGFEVWSGGAGPFTVNGAETADKWFIRRTAGTISVSKNTIGMDTYYSKTCVAVTYTHAGVETTLYQIVHGSFVGLASRVALSVRLKVNQPNAVRLKVGSVYGPFHSGSNEYETLVMVAPVPSDPFDVEIAFNASCAALIDNMMVVQGSAPIDYISLTQQDNQRRITDY